MANENKKISQLPLGGSVQVGDLVPVARAGKSYKCTVEGSGGQKTLGINSVNINWELDDNAATFKLTGDRMVKNPTNKVAGKTYQLEIKQDAVGGHSLTWGTNFKWVNGISPTLSTAPNARDRITFTCNGTYMDGIVNLNFS